MKSTAYTLTHAAQIPILAAQLERLLAAGKPLRLVVGPKPSRSREQLAYLHLAIRQLAEHTGTSESELKEFFKAEYGPPAIVTIAGRAATVKKSVGDYTSQEASDMIEHVTRVAAECGMLLSPDSHNGL